MIKVFLIIAAVVLGASVYFGIQNRNEFIETRKNKDNTNKEIKETLADTDKEIATLTGKHKTLNETHSQRDTALAQKERFKERTEEQQTQLNTANQIKSTLMAEKAEYDQVIADFEARFPDVDGLPGVVKKVDEMKVQETELEKEQKELELNVATLTAQVEKDRKTINTFEDRKAKRSLGIALNGTEGTITAVNQDWGFVVIGIGSNQGVTADSELIVKRDGDVVGKLSIVSIEPRLTVADILMDTLKDGARILPGDLVIFEKLQN